MNQSADIQNLTKNWICIRHCSPCRQPDAGLRRGARARGWRGPRAGGRPGHAGDLGIRRSACPEASGMLLLRAVSGPWRRGGPEGRWRPVAAGRKAEAGRGQAATTSVGKRQFGATAGSPSGWDMDPVQLL